MRLLVVAAGLLCLTWADPAFACSCGGFGDRTPEAYRTWLNGFAGEVFQGTVVETSMVRGRLGLKVTFRVERYWKGVPAPEVVLYTQVGTSCDIRLGVGESHVVAAVREDDRLTFGRCLLLFVNENPTAFVEGIGEGSPPPKATQ